MDFYGFIRIVNVILYLVIFVAMVAQYRSYRLQDERIRLFGLGLLMMLLINAGSTVDIAIKGFPGGLRNIFQTFPLVVFIIALFWPHLSKVTIRVIDRIDRVIEDRKRHHAQHMMR